MDEQQDEALSDGAVLYRVAHGETELFSIVFRRYSAKAYGHALAHTRHVHDARDVVAMAFATLWDKRAEVRIVGDSVWPWLSVTIAHVAGNLRRSQRRYAALLARIPALESVADHADEVERAIASTEISRDVIEALAGLRRHERDVVLLCLVQGCTIVDAAQVLGVPEGTVKSRLARSRERLKLALEHLSPVRGGAYS